MNAMGQNTYSKIDVNPKLFKLTRLKNQATKASMKEKNAEKAIKFDKIAPTTLTIETAPCDTASKKLAASLK
jgi:hypothetical protein